MFSRHSEGGDDENGPDNASSVIWVLVSFFFFSHIWLILNNRYRYYSCFKGLRKVATTMKMAQTMPDALFGSIVSFFFLLLYIWLILTNICRYYLCFKGIVKAETTMKTSQTTLTCHNKHHTPQLIATSPLHQWHHQCTQQMATPIPTPHPPSTSTAANPPWCVQWPTKGHHHHLYKCPSLLASFSLLPHLILMVSFPFFFLRLLFTNQPHTQWHQEPMERINNTCYP